MNRNKRAITLDLKNPHAIELVEKLVSEYDILVEQFRPGVMGRLGLGYERLKEINPGLIYCSITGYGQTGPYRDRAGHDINYLSIAGVNGYSGREGERTPIMGTQIANPIKMSLCRPRYDYAGVALGEHNNDVLQEIDVDESLRDALQTSTAMG